MRYLLASVTVVLTTTTICGQVPTAQFEVVSIKPTPETEHGPRWQDARSIGGVNGDRDFAMRDGTIGALVLYAYPVQTDELLRAPEWVRTERYEVRASRAVPTSRDERQQMVRGLLAERMKLTAHYERMMRPIFRLVRTHKGGPIRPSVRPIADCAVTRAAQDQAAPVEPGTVRPCRSLFASGHVASTGITMKDLAAALSRFAGRVVVDSTGLVGDFAFDLKWRPLDTGQGTSDVTGPTLGQALDELGLKLEPSRQELAVLVIDHIERPTED